MSYDNWKARNPADEFLGPEPWETAMDEHYAAVAKAAAAWRKRWPSACPSCGGWGGSSYTEMHGFTHGCGEQMFDVCEAMGPEFCHRCGYEGFDDNHDGLHTDDYSEGPEGIAHRRVCWWCGHNDDDGDPGL